MPPQVLIITPAKPGSLKGNRITAERWASHLRDEGVHVDIQERYESGLSCDVLIALHARRSADSVRQFRDTHPTRPLILVLTGTDLHRDIHHDPSAQESLRLASHIVGLHHLAREELPPELRSKVRTIVQSATAAGATSELASPRSEKVFQVCVLGHLRTEKDPFRTAMAVRDLPASSRVRVLHIGHALTPEMHDRALAEMATNSRYRWLGEQPQHEALKLLSTCQLHVLTSEMEGGANAICEALACGVPTLASSIPGSIGLLGKDYPGYFPLRDTEALRQQLRRCENDETFYRELQTHTARLAPMVSPRHEKNSLMQLLQDATSSPT